MDDYSTAPGQVGGGRRRLLAGTLSVLIYLLVGGVALMWAWNTIGHGLFGGPQARFVHAIALLLGILLLALPFRGHEARPWIDVRDRHQIRHAARSE